MTDEHRPEKPPAHRPENNQQQPEHAEHRPENYPDPGLAEMYKDGQYVLEDADSLRLDPDPAAPAPPIPNPGPRITFDQADPNPQWGNPDPSGPIKGGDSFEFRPNPSQLGVEGEISPTEEAKDSGWPYYDETNPTGEASLLEQSDAGTGQGGLVDPHLTEDPSTAAYYPEVQEQEDFFEGV